MRYPTRLRESWFWSRAAAVWLALGVLPVLFFQTAVHEGSHCVLMEVTGLGCKLTAPFAISSVEGWSAYGATFADDEGAVTAPVSVTVAPQVVAALLVVALWLAMRVPRAETLTVLGRLWLLGAAIDLLNNTSGTSGAIGDWANLADMLGLSRTGVLALSAPAWALVAWGLLAPLPAPRPPRAPRARDLWPIGAVYAGISALAVWVSVSVHVPDSDPTTLWHRVPILLQLGSVAVCLGIVASARLGRREAA
jgi:hypothetical protein